MVANGSRHHIRKAFDRVRNGIRRKAIKKSEKKAKRRATSVNMLLKKLTRETLTNAARYEDFDIVMDRLRTIWRQETGVGVTHDNDAYDSMDQQSDENAIPASASIIRRFFKLPGAKRSLATELFSRLLTDLENEQIEQ